MVKEHEGCLVGSCPLTATHRGMCNAHYKRWQRHGDPEAGRHPIDTCTIEGCENPHHAQGYCTAHHHRYMRHGDPLSGGAAQPHGLTPLERFERYVVKGDPDECWLWNGAVTGVGYGAIFYEGRIQGAHRVAWQIANGKSIPESLMILHKCDNPPCVNPNHLTIGSHADNMEDARVKGRFLMRPQSLRLQQKQREVANAVKS